MRANSLYRVGVVLIAIGALAIACRSPITNISPVDLSPLFLDVDEFPDGWSDQYGLSSRKQAPFGGAKYQFQNHITFTAPNNIAFQEVRLFRNPAEAAEEFERQTQVQFREEFYVWEPTTAIAFHSAVAEQYRLECAKDGVDMRCVMVAQYKMLVVSFGASVGSTLTYGQFDGLLRLIDARFQNYLSVSNP